MSLMAPNKILYFFGAIERDTYDLEMFQIAKTF